MTKKYAKIVNEDTKQCEVGLGTNVDFYKKMGMTELDVEQGYDCGWYLKGYAPQKPLEELKAEKLAELKANRIVYKKATQINSNFTYWDCDAENNIYNFNNIINGICGWTEEERALFIEITEFIANKYDIIKQAINEATLETIDSISTTF